jgi:hypothetical protein
MPTLSANLIQALESAHFLQCPFAEQRGGQRKRNLKCFGDILETLSGGDKASLLHDFFSSRGGRPLLEQLGLEPKDTSQQIMEALRLLHASAPSRKDKRAVLSAVSPVFSRAQLRQKGLRFSPATLTRVRNGTRTEKPNGSISQSAVLNAQPSPSAISNAKSLALRFFGEHSREAANRTVTLKRTACDDPDCGADHNSKKRCVTMDG